MERKDNSTEALIQRLQDNLMIIRKVAGWTSDDLADRIGVTRQTISNLENKRTRMTEMQYIAICAVLDYEMKANPENDTLPAVVEVLLNNPENYDKQIVDKAVEAIKAASASSTSAATIALSQAALLAPLGLLGGHGLVIGLVAKFIGKRSKKKSK